MPAQLRLRPGGINIYSHPEFGEVESHSSTCSHCQHITDFESRRRMMDHVDFCRSCMKLICLPCVGRPCIPYEKQAEIEEAADRLRARIHQQAWKCY